MTTAESTVSCGLSINPMDLTGRRILVTGASSGIGREAAVLLAKLGAVVTAVGRDTERLSRTVDSLEGSGHECAVFDLEQLEQIPTWMKGLAAHHGPFAGLVHCAGLHSAMPISLMRAATLETLMRVNVYSAAMLVRGFRQKQCRAPNDASIVLLSSVAGLAGEPGISAYSASKAALLGLTRALAIELAPERIRVNAITPGFVETEMGAKLRESLTDEQFNGIRAKHPLGIGHPSDVADGIAFLLADTGRWITGTTLIIDGGYTAH